MRQYMKTGAPARGESVKKYNGPLRIAEYIERNETIYEDRRSGLRRAYRETQQTAEDSGVRRR
jgi:hypothetical protein